MGTKLLSQFLCALFLALLGTATYGQSITFTTNNITYRITGAGGVEVQDYVGTATDVTIPYRAHRGILTYRVTSIGYRAFQANALTSVIIGENVETIGDDAFRSNPLTSVTVLALTPPSLVGSLNDAFSDRGNIDLFVPSGTKATYESHGDWDGFKSIRETVNFTITGIINGSIDENVAYTSAAPVLSGDAPIGTVTYTLGGTDRVVVVSVLLPEEKPTFFYFRNEETVPVELEAYRVNDDFYLNHQLGFSRPIDILPDYSLQEGLLPDNISFLSNSKPKNE